jgi:hypothetical protein
MHGRIQAAYADYRGDTLAVALSVGGTTLTVGDVADFDEDGGWLLLDDATAAVEYTTCDDDTSTVALAAASPVAVAVGEPIRVWDPDAQSVAVECVAQVITDEDGLLEAVIDHALIPLAGVGIASYNGKSVELDYDDDTDLRVTQILGVAPAMDLSTAIPGTIPDLNPVEAPTVSPDLEIFESAEFLVVKAGATDVTTKIEYHISTTDGFTPDATTLSRTTSSKLENIGTLPDGTDLALDTTYYLRAVATNAAGSAPPSAQVSGSLDPSKVSSIALAEVAAGIVMAGRIEVGNGYWDPDEGLVLPQPNGTATRLSNDGVTPSTLSGYAVLDGASVADNLNLYGLAQEFGTYRLTNGISDPAVKAGMSRTWNSLQTNVGFPGAQHGLADNSAGTQWVVVGSFGNASITTIDKSTGVSGPVAPSGTDWRPKFDAQGGIVRIGSSYYVMGYDGNRGSWWVYQLNSTFGKTAEFNVGTSYAHGPALGTDGTNILIARIGSGGDMHGRIYNTSGTQLSDTTLAGPAGVADLGGVYYGTADFGANRWVVAARGGSVYAFDSTGARVTSHEFPNAGASKIRGLHWDSTRFRHLDDTGRIWDYATGHVSTATWYGGYTWYDNDTTSGSTTHETKVSPAASFSWPARSRITVTGQPAPEAGVTDPTKTDKANLVQIYLGSSAAAMRLQGGGPLALGTKALTLENPNTGSTIAPTATNFGTVAAAPGVFESAAQNGSALPHLQIKGDGSVRAAKLMQSSQWSTGAFTASGSANAKTTTITFDPPFDATPTVMCTPATDPATGSVWATAVSTTGCTLNAYRITGTAGIGVNWIAVARTQ